jgi:hypothetical protein
MKQITNSLSLYLIENPEVSLTRLEFHPAHSHTPFVGIRGSSTPPNAIPLRWGPTLHALTLLFLKASLISRKVEYLLPVLEGGRGSPAANISRLLTKAYQRNCLDLFGTDSAGRSTLSRILILCNSRFYHSGPAQVYVRETLLPSSSIRVFLGNEEISHNRSKLSEIAQRLTSSWVPGSSGSKEGQNSPLRKVRSARSGNSLSVEKTKISRTKKETSSSSSRIVITGSPRKGAGRQNI